jgi:glycosidase
VALAASALAGSVIVAACGPTPSPTPAPSTPPAAEADRAPLAPDGQVDAEGLAHDSRDDTYRVPFGAVPAGTAVTLRLRATAGDLTEATVRVWDELEKIQALVPMEVIASDRTAGEHGVDYWQATLRTSAKPTVLWYRFIIRDGPTTRYLEDDPPDDGAAVPEGADGGPGRVYEESIDAAWQITTYDAAFTTPSWAPGAVVYQVFPDRFVDGDPANNPTPDATKGTEGADRFRYGDVYGNPILAKAWGDRPEGYCRAYQGVTCDEVPLGRDFFGGDLAGVTAKLDDLAALGVTVLYFNPVFAAPSNHRYDTSSYDVVDPDLGTEEDLATLVAEARARGVRVVLDGVFNHVSSDSPWFDRERRFAETGACEAADSPYRGWFTFRAPKPNEPAPCAASAAGDDTYYVGWFGFDTIPELVEQGAVDDLFVGADGVVGRWVRAGTAGWRLDVMDNMSHGFIRDIRGATKAADPDAIVLGEQWLDASAWLLGDQADSVMNYRFRRAVIGLVNGDTADLDGAIVGLTPSQFASRMASVMEDYPRPAWDALLNLVDSHDTTRILWTLAPGPDDPAVKESAEGLAEAKAKLRLVAALQLTWPGMASIYYGTEAGLTGHDDPDDRRPYPWDAIDTELRDWYRELGGLRAARESLRMGDLRFVHADDAAGTLGYVRRTDTEAALVVLNLGAEPRTVEVDLAEALPPSAVLVDAFGGGSSVTVGAGPVTVAVPARGVAILATAPGADLARPAAPDSLAATATEAIVELAWDAVDEALTYDVLRSIVPGGGYRPVVSTNETSFTDATARPGTRYYYVVVARDAAGNPSPRSPEVSALPEVTIEEARLEEPAEVSQPLSAVEPGAPIRALVRATGTEAPGAVVGVRAQLGLGPAQGDPATEYAWSEMAFEADAEGADRLVGSVRPEAEGTFNVVLRVSTDDGSTWAYADRGGIVTAGDAPSGYRPDQAVTLTATPAADTAPPAAPAAPAVANVAGSSLTLTWPLVTAPDLLRYEVLRGTGDGALEMIGSAVEPRFTDDTIAAGATYVYAIVAVDTSFNRSAPSPETSTQAEARAVEVTFTVRLPADTPPADTIFIAGDFQGWNPAGTPMTKVDATTWTITLPFTEGDALQYKFTRGSWEAVEKDDACGEIPNRELTVTFGEDGALPVEDTVAKWRDVDQCG